MLLVLGQRRVHAASIAVAGRWLLLLGVTTTVRWHVSGHPTVGNAVVLVAIFSRRWLVVVKGAIASGGGYRGIVFTRVVGRLLLLLLGRVCHRWHLWLRWRQ